MKKILFTIAMLLLLVGCSTNNVNPQQSDISYKNSVVVEEINYSIKLVDDRMDFDRIEVSKGVKVNLEIVSLNNNEEVIFEILDFDIAETIPVGRAVTVSFVPEETGEFEYGFRNSIIKGLIVVE